MAANECAPTETTATATTFKRSAEQLPTQSIKRNHSLRSMSPTARLARVYRADATGDTRFSRMSPRKPHATKMISVYFPRGMAEHVAGMRRGGAVGRDTLELTCPYGDGFVGRARTRVCLCAGAVCSMCRLSVCAAREFD